MLGIIAIIAELILFFIIFFRTRKKGGIQKALKNLAIALVLGGFLTFALPLSGKTDNTLFDSAREYIGYASFSSRFEEFAAVGAAEAPDAMLPAVPEVFVMQLDTEGNCQASPINFRLPGGLKAKSAESVNVLVRIQWGKTQVGSYTDGAGAYQNAADISVIKLTDGTLLAHETINGDSPPSSKSGSGDRSGSMPYKDVERCVLDTLEQR